MSYYKGYVPTNGKQAKIKFANGAKLKTLEEVKNLPEYAGVLENDIILVDIDDSKQSEILMDIIEDKQIGCRVYQTARGRHFLFINKGVTQAWTGTKLACGLTADIKIGSKNSYEVLKLNGEERFIEWDYPPQDLPKFLLPVSTSIDFMDMEEGDGRNSSLFKYELVLGAHGLTPFEIKETIKIINDYVLEEPLSTDELETVTRDEALAKPIFYEGKSFKHNVFGDYLKSQFYIRRINGQLYVYNGKIYETGYRAIEERMLEVLPSLKATQRAEVLKYLEITSQEAETAHEANLIAFRNGLYDLRTGELRPFGPEHVITNMVPWDYNPNAYDQLADTTMDKMACQNTEIRALLEECIGYCFFRENEMAKSFILTGSGSNGKSTYLDMVKNVLGRENYVSLDIDELSEKFSTSAMFGRLANIGDDISDDYLAGKQLSVFKKIVSGNDIKGENKGQDIFFFKPSVKLLFSANEIPRVRNKGFKAIKRRLVIIPFNANFSKDDPDYDAGITWKLKSQNVAEYLVRLGVDGLKRVLASQAFTECRDVNEQLDRFEKDNNPILLFLDEVDASEILNHTTKETFRRYDLFCAQSGYQRIALQTFSKEITRILDCQIKDKKINGRKERVFIK